MEGGPAGVSTIAPVNVVRYVVVLVVSGYNSIVLGGIYFDLCFAGDGGVSWWLIWCVNGSERPNGSRGGCTVFIGSDDLPVIFGFIVERIWCVGFEGMVVCDEYVGCWIIWFKIDVISECVSIWVGALPGECGGKWYLLGVVWWCGSVWSFRWLVYDGESLGC